MKMGVDSNGNRVLKVEGSDLGTKRGFSIQTLHDMPETHRNGVCEATDKELRDYIKAYGTKRQKELFSL